MGDTEQERGTAERSDEECHETALLRFPWVTDTLKEPDARLARSATLTFARALFEHAVPLPPEVEKALQDFEHRFDASPTIARLLRFGAPPKIVAWMLQELVRAYAVGFRTQYINRPIEEADPLSVLPTHELRAKAEGIPALRHPTLAGYEGQLQEAYRTAYLARRLMEMTRWRERGQPWSPLRWMAEAVDAIWEAPRPERDRVIAALGREILGDEGAEPDRVKEMMKPSRRTRRRLTSSPSL